MRHAHSSYRLVAVAFGTALALTACGGGDDDNDVTPVATGPTLSALNFQVISNNGEALEPKFDPNVHEYTLRVQSDIYAVLLQPTASADVQINVQAATTAGVYSATVANTDVATPEAVNYANSNGPYGYMVKLSQSYASYDVAYAQTATLNLSDVKTGLTSKYTLNIVRDNDAPTRQKFGTEKVFTAASGTQIKYHIYYPPNYQTATKRYPVVLSLHGAGQRASTGQPADMVLKRYKQATIWAQDAEANIAKEAIVIAPQANTAWVASDPNGVLSPDGQAAYELLSDVITKERVNANRVYLTGLSLGGNGALVMAQLYPQTFTALYIGATWAGSPNSATNTGAGYNWAAYKQYFDNKIRIFHAVDDPQVAFSNYQNITNRLTAAGVSYQSKIYAPGTFFYPDAHFSWTPAYADQSAREWLFSQTK